jgi:hypothetical protein
VYWLNVLNARNLIHTTCDSGIRPMCLKQRRINVNLRSVAGTLPRVLYVFMYLFIYLFVPALFSDVNNLV